MLRSSVICHIRFFGPAYSRHVLGRLLDVQLNSVGICFAYTISSAKPYQPSVAGYRQDRIVVNCLPCSFFTVRAYFKEARYIRISRRNDFRQFERNRLSESKFVNRTDFSDLRSTRPDCIEVYVLVYAVQFLLRPEHSAAAVCLCVPSHENKPLTRHIVHEIFNDVSEVRNALSLHEDVSACVFMISDQASFCRNDSCTSVFACLFDSKSVACSSPVSVQREILSEKYVGQPCAFCEHSAHVRA